MKCSIFAVVAASITTCVLAMKKTLPIVYTYSNATSFMPEGSPFITFMFDLPMYSTLDNETYLLSNPIGMERGSCNMELETGLIVCNIIQVFDGDDDGGQLMLQGTGNTAKDCTLHAIVGATGAYAGLTGSTNECDLPANDVVSFTYNVWEEEDKASSAAESSWGIFGSYYSIIVAFLVTVAAADGIWFV